MIPEKPPFIAKALPVRPAIRAWLSLVGIPKYHATTAHKTMEKSAAARAMLDFSLFSPKDTIFITVSVTAGLILLVMKTPAKLNIADRKTAGLSGRQRVVMQVATELGASVKPFTYITEKVSKSVVMLSGESEDIKVKIKPPPENIFLKNIFLGVVIYVVVYFSSRNLFIASKDSGLITCSILQASSAAIFSSTPKVVSIFVIIVWRSKMFCASLFPSVVNLI